MKIYEVKYSDGRDTYREFFSSKKEALQLWKELLSKKEETNYDIYDIYEINLKLTKKSVIDFLNIYIGWK